MLNQALYDSLKRVFGKVKVANQGQKAHIKKEIKYTTSGYDEVSKQYVKFKVEDGEQYKVCCPECGDTNFHLYIHYLFGSLDPVGNVFNRLAYCHRRQCDVCEELQWKLNLASVEIVPSAAANTPDIEVPEIYVSPGETVSLDQLSLEHKANQYLINRKFDPYFLAKHYGLSYCLSNDYRTKNRIVIPFFNYDTGEQLGWQARALDDKIKPKYYFMQTFKKNKFIFHSKHTKNLPIVLLVEGVFDAIRACPYGVAVLGNTVSQEQKLLLSKIITDKTIILLAYDNDVTPEIEFKFINSLNGLPNKRRRLVIPPEFKDVGELDNTILLDIIEKSLK